jgi:hypothetical protein
VKIFILASAVSIVMATSLTAGARAAALKTVHQRAAGAPFVVVLSRNGQEVGQRITAPEGANDVHVLFPESGPPSSAGAAPSQTYLVAIFTRNGVPTGKPALSKPRQNDFELVISCCPFMFRVTISIGSTLRAMKVPTGANGVALYLYGGAKYTSYQWVLPTARTRPIPITGMNADGIAVSYCYC